MTTATKTYTLDEFAALPGDGKRYELVKGELIEMPPAGEEHGAIEGNTLGYLWAYNQQQNLGRVYTSDTTFILDQEKQTARLPDVSFVAKERVVRTPGFVPFAPDLAVEVVSPNDLWSEIDDKIEEYLQAGVRLIWIIYPRRQVVYVYRAGSSNRQTLQLNDELDGEDVLPGFKLKVSALFE